MRSPALRFSKSLWSYNPLPTGCVLFAPFWHPDLSGLVSKSVDLFGRTCTVSGSTPVRTSNGWDFPGVDEMIDIGNIGTNIRTLSFWINPDGNESILEEVDNTGPSIAGGSMSYGSWDDCFVDGVNTDVISAAWHHVMLTSTTSVDMSAFRLGLVNVTYFDGGFGEVAAWTVEYKVAGAKQHYQGTNERYQ